MNKTEFINRQRKVKVTKELKDMLALCVDTALKTEGIDDGAHIDVTFVSDKRIREINREYRQKDAATDVLSFPMVEFSEGKPVCDLGGERDEDGVLFLGDIVISLEHAWAQAEEYGHSFMREAGFLCTHSVLHLVGYDHEDDEESRKTMRKKEEAVLKKVGLAR
ncbi:MAG: rRNA maturation RNase YbeY [Clostridia bacterium]|nr:rRNA maturation RNase YbeY [Clostridia bacterium]